MHPIDHGHQNRIRASQIHGLAALQFGRRRGDSRPRGDEGDGPCQGESQNQRAPKFSSIPAKTADEAKMSVDGDEATYTFTLRWNRKLLASEHTNYQIEFAPELSIDTDPVPPTVHKITVTPDWPPDISILTPRTKEIEVPVNGSQQIEIRALDPDYGLTEISLHASATGPTRPFDQDVSPAGANRSSLGVLRFPSRRAEAPARRSRYLVGHCQGQLHATQHHANVELLPEYCGGRSRPRRWVGWPKRQVRRREAPKTIRPQSNHSHLKAVRIANRPTIRSPDRAAAQRDSRRQRPEPARRFARPEVGPTRVRPGTEQRRPIGVR